MLTGIVKLAQIDDYISPSQNCVQPKIMKPDTAKQTATVTLNDCLACSGCITSAESVLIEQMSINKFIQIANNGINKIALMIAPQVLLSLSRYYNLSPLQCFEQMNRFFMDNFKTVVGLFQMSKAIQICHQLIIDQLMERIQNKSTPVLCSECPGWVCYSEKTLTQKVTNLMSHVKSPQQIMSHLLKHRYGKQCKVVSIMPCYDKKLQAIRFDLSEKVKEVDLTIATIEFIELVKKIGTNGSRLMPNEKRQQKQIKSEQTKTSQKTLEFEEIPTSQQTSNSKQQQQNPDQQRQQIKFIKDQASNGYIEFILDRLGIKDYKCEQIKNSDYKEYSFEWKGNQYKMAKCYGFKNIQKIVQSIKKDKCVYLYVQIMACPGGCFGGGGQVRYEGVKNKDVFAKFDAMMEGYEIVGGARAKINIKNEEIELQKLYFKYKPIEKTLTQAVLNW